MLSSLIIALDFAHPQQALDFAQQIKGLCPRVKVGKELFTRAGPSLIETLIKHDFQVFLDLKYHDIPNTVAQACRAAADLGVWMLNVHALGGRNMLLAAKETLDQYQNRPLLIAVTILTSLDAKDLQMLGLSGSVSDNVLRLARLTQACGLDGLVCSPQEITLLRQTLSPNLKLVTPGIRLSNDPTHDQKRVMTPQAALSHGADYLVVGRAVTATSDPVETLRKFSELTSS